MLNTREIPKYQADVCFSALHSFPSISVSHLNASQSLSSLMDDFTAKEQRPVRGVVEAFIAFEMTLYALYRKGNRAVLLFQTN